MTLAQAQTLHEALFPEAGRVKGGASAVPEIRTQGDLDALLEATRKGEFVL